MAVGTLQNGKVTSSGCPNPVAAAGCREQDPVPGDINTLSHIFKFIARPNGAPDRELGPPFLLESGVAGLHQSQLDVSLETQRLRAQGRENLALRPPGCHDCDLSLSFCTTLRQRQPLRVSIVSPFVGELETPT